MIYILGGKGFVGSGIARYCENNSIKHIVITRDNYQEYVGTKCDIFINANGNSKKFIANKDPVFDFESSVLTVRKSLVDFEFNRYVLLSSCDVYPDCSTPDTTNENHEIDVTKQSAYGFHKYLAEQCVQHVANNWIIFRCGGFVGPGLWKNPVYDIMNNLELYMSPSSKLQYINTNTAGDICVNIAKNETIKNQIINLSSIGTIELQSIIEKTNSSVTLKGKSEPQQYEISTDKLSQYVTVPSTEETVMSFVDGELKNN